VHGVADAHGLGTVRKYSGHGIGANLHMLPMVLHFRNRETLSLQPGMIFTIEPMITEGSPDTFVWEDGWTVVSSDGGRGAQFEHTVLITEDGAEVITVPEEPPEIPKNEWD
jgi:methionyl aminopeptidase